MNSFINYAALQIIDMAKAQPLNYLYANKKWISDLTINRCELLKNDNKSLMGLAPFEKDVRLKFLITEILANATQSNKNYIYKWIVEDWGGIKTNKRFEILERLATDKNSFDRVSSWSKIASFNNIEDNVIYDSRVVYALNWLIYKYNFEYNESKKYYRQPDGRNKKLGMIPITSLIEAFVDKSAFYAKQNTAFYSDFCEVIKGINIIVFDAENELQILDSSISIRRYPFFTEMLLFKMADEQIFEDIRNSILLRPKTKRSIKHLF